MKATSEVAMRAYIAFALVASTVLAAYFLLSNGPADVPDTPKKSITSQASESSSVPLRESASSDSARPLPESDTTESLDPKKHDLATRSWRLKLRRYLRAGGFEQQIVRSASLEHLNRLRDELETFEAAKNEVSQKLDGIYDKLAEQKLREKDVEIVESFDVVDPSDDYLVYGSGPIDGKPTRYLIRIRTTDDPGILPLKQEIDLFNMEIARTIYHRLTDMARRQGR